LAAGANRLRDRLKFYFYRNVFRFSAAPRLQRRTPRHNPLSRVLHYRPCPAAPAKYPTLQRNTRHRVLSSTPTSIGPMIPPNAPRHNALRNTHSPTAQNHGRRPHSRSMRSTSRVNKFLSQPSSTRSCVGGHPAGWPSCQHQDACPSRSAPAGQPNELRIHFGGIRNPEDGHLAGRGRTEPAARWRLYGQAQRAGE
jgi:hypothetical protein